MGAGVQGAASSRSSGRCEGSGLHRGVYSSSSCSLFLLGFAAQAYCRAVLHRKEKEVVCFKLIMGAGEECERPWAPGLARSGDSGEDRAWSLLQELCEASVVVAKPTSPNGPAWGLHPGGQAEPGKGVWVHSDPAGSIAWPRFRTRLLSGRWDVASCRGVLWLGSC